MRTISEQIAEDIHNLKQLAGDFFANHVRIKYVPPMEGVFGFSDYEWCDLDQKGQQLQAQLYREYSYLTELMGILISVLPPEYQREFDECKSEVFSYIEQDGQVWESSTEIVFQKFNANLDKQLQLLQNLYSKNGSGNIIVPDTNALLTNPHLDKWTFDEVTNFEILLTPSVLSELDQLKVAGRNDEIRNKAQSIIRTIKEYRSRGRLTEGVTLKRSVSTLRALAVEPNFETTFSWLKEDNKDDRLLASFVEIIRSYPNSVVLLATADINLQNKAEYARLPFVEPCSED